MSAGVAINVASARERVGCKGPAAEAWLAHHGVNVPSGANRYVIDPSGVLSARLATSEFLLEALLEEASAAIRTIRLALENADCPKGVYPVLRQDFVLEIGGPRAPHLFRETCAVDLEPVTHQARAAEGPVIMTSMIGVSVVLICSPRHDGPRFTVWSDPSYSAYFRSQLLAIAADLENETGGTASLAPSTRSGGKPP